MKVTSAIFASAVVATATTQFVSMTPSPIGLLNQPSCFTLGQVNLGHGFDALEPAIVKSFEKDILKPKATVKYVREEVRGSVKVQHLDISVTAKRAGGWTDGPEITMVRCKALLNVVGTLNLYYPDADKPWVAKITIDTDGTKWEFVPSGTYSRPSKFIADCKNYAIEKTCKVPFPI
jgi:hypothetical protein